MIDYAKLLLTTDADTLKNDDSATTTLTIPGSATVTASNRRLETADVNVGQANSSALCFVSNSKDASKTYPVVIGTRFERTGSVGGSAANYAIHVSATRLDADTVRFSAFIANPYASTLTLASGDEVFTFSVKTIVEPF